MASSTFLIDGLREEPLVSAPAADAGHGGMHAGLCDVGSSKELLRLRLYASLVTIDAVSVVLGFMLALGVTSVFSVMAVDGDPFLDAGGQVAMWLMAPLWAGACPKLLYPVKTSASQPLGPQAVQDRNGRSSWRKVSPARRPRRRSRDTSRPPTDRRTGEVHLATLTVRWTSERTIAGCSSLAP